MVSPGEVIHMLRSYPHMLWIDGEYLTAPYFSRFRPFMAEVQQINPPAARVDKGP